MSNDINSNYETLWQHYSEHISSGKNKDALGVLDSIGNMAKKDENDAQLLKTYFSRASTIAHYEDNIKNQILFIEKHKTNLTSGSAIAICNSYLAELYTTYLQKHTFKLRNSTEIFSEIIPDSLEDYSLVQLQKKANQYANLSLKSEDTKTILLNEYGPIIEKLDVNGAIYRNTVYDLLVHRAIQHYSNSSNLIPQTKNEFSLNQDVAFAQSDPFLQYDFNAKGDSSGVKEVILLFQKLEKENKSNENKQAFIQLNRLEYVYRNSTHPNKIDLYEKALETLYSANEKSPILAHVSSKYITHVISRGNTLLGNIEKENPYFIKAQSIIDHTLTLKLNAKERKHIEYLKQQINTKSLNVVTEQVYPSVYDFPIKIDYRNIKNVQAELYRLEKEDLIKYYEDSNKERTFGTKVKSFDISLLGTEDLDQHSLEYTMESLNDGAYLLVLKAKNGNLKSYALFHVSNIAAVKVNNNLQVMDRMSGNPKQAKIERYKREWKRNGNVLKYIDSKETSINGLATFIESRESYLFHISSDESSLFTSDNFYYQEYSPRRKNVYTLNFTDRAIYRPGQTVYFKSILYNTHTQSVLPNEKITVELLDANYQLIESSQIKTNEFGSVNGEFKIPTDVLNGQFSLRFSLAKENISSVKSIRVEEYKRPTFKIEFETVKETYSFGNEVKSVGKAISYNEVPVNNQNVEYSIVRNQVYRWYYSRYYNPTPAKIIANGEVKTDEKGKFLIAFTPELPQTQNQYNTYSYTIEAKITDEKGETRTQQTVIYVSDKDFIIHSNKQNYTHEDQDIQIHLTNQNGERIHDKITCSIYELEAPSSFFINKKWEAEFNPLNKEEYNKRTVIYPYKDETRLENLPILKEISKEDISIDSLYIYSLNNLTNGLFKIILSSPNADTVSLFIDNNKNSFYNKSVLNVQSPESILCNNTLEVNLNSLHNLHMYEVENRQNGGSTYKAYPILKSNNQLYSISKSDEGGIELHYFTYFNNRYHKISKFIQVKDPKKELKLTWETFRSELYPGSEEKWRLKILDNENQIVPIELVTSLYDKSLDAFYKHNWSTFTIPNTIKRSDISPYSDHTTYSRNYNKERYTGSFLDPFDFPYIHTNIPIAFRHRNGGYYFDGEHVEVMMEEGAVLDEVTVTGNGKQGPIKKARRALASKVSGVMNGDMASASYEAPSVENEDSSLNSQDLDNNASSNNDDGFIRTNLNETVFFKPDLVTNSEGDIVLEFTMNEALTEWKLLAFGHSKYLQFISDEESIRTKKDLMVFPNGPRFFRKGDQIVIPADIRNMSASNLNIKAEIKIFDIISNKEITSLFTNSKKIKALTIDGGKNALVEWSLKIPENIDGIRYQIIATSDLFKDGEEKTAIVLDNRKMVTESKVYVINEKETASLETSLKNSQSIDPKLYNISVVSNPSWLAVQTLPYLMEYRYKCTEQIFSRYFSNVLAKHILDENPSIEKVYKDWNAKNQLKSNLNKNEELKYVLLEQTPWVLDALDEEQQMEQLATLFDRERVRAELIANQEVILSRSMQGALPWFPKGRPNLYITQYILQGFGQLRKLDVMEEDPKMNVFYKESFSYIQDEWNKMERSSIPKPSSVSPLQIHFLYTSSFFKDLKLKLETKTNVKRWVKIIKKDWISYSLLNKAQLALYFHRNGDAEFASTILEHLRQTSIFKENLGRYWKETNGYFWYQSNLEAQSLLMVAFQEIEQNTAFVEELKQWLLSNKQTNKWNSTKSTTQAVYAILETGENKLSEQKLVKVEGVNSSLINQSEIKKAVGEYNIQYTSSSVNDVPNSITVSNPNSTKAWVSTTYQYVEDIDKIEQYQETPLKIRRALFKKQSGERGPVLIPLEANDFLEIGDELVIKLTLEVDRPMEFIHIQDSRASGTEPKSVLSGYTYQNGLYYYEETKDEATNFFIDYLPRGVYNFEYTVYASQKGDFSAGLATIQSMYAPEFNAHSSGMRIEIK